MFQKTIAFANQKGGVGKSTTAAMFALGLHHRGYKVLLVDIDGQRNLTDWLCGELPEGTLTAFELLTGSSPAKDIVRTVAFGFDFIPSKQELYQVETVLPMAGKLKRLKKGLASVKASYDYLLIDCPPSFSALSINALVAADEVIIPANAHAFSINGFIDFNNNFNDVKENENPTLVNRGILITMFNARSNVMNSLRSVIDEYSEQLGTTAFKTVIRQSVAVIEAQASQADMFAEYPNNIATKDYSAFIDEYLEGGQ
ncbi:MAG: ParA family protein [Erysipelotrichaceae bacterium]